MLLRRLADSERALELARRNAEEWSGARDILSEVLLGTQTKAAEFASQVVSLALSTIYGDGVSFELKYRRQRNQVEATPWIVKDGERFSPRDEVGGGVLDVASLALRLAVWAMSEPRTSPVFVLDEPGKFLSPGLRRDFGRMLGELSEMLGTQFVVVTHSPQVAEHAGAAYHVSQAGGVSKVEKAE